MCTVPSELGWGGAGLGASCWIFPLLPLALFHRVKGIGGFYIFGGPSQMHV